MRILLTLRSTASPATGPWQPVTMRRRPPWRRAGDLDSLTTKDCDVVYEMEHGRLRGQARTSELVNPDRCTRGTTATLRE